MVAPSKLRKDSESLIRLPKREEDAINLLRINSPLVFCLDDKHPGTFTAKLKIKNQSERYVSFKVVSSNQKKFQVLPDHLGLISPRSSAEVLIVTSPSKVTSFQEISKDSFHLFAIPIYDKRQMDKEFLSSLWQAHGSSFFPLHCVEKHTLSSILPKSDSYFDELSPLECLTFYNLLPSNSSPPEVLWDDDLIDDDDLLSRWPSKDALDEVDPSLQGLLQDWSALNDKVNRQTEVILDSTKLTLAVLLFGAGIIMGLIGLGAGEWEGLTIWKALLIGTKYLLLCHWKKI